MSIRLLQGTIAENIARFRGRCHQCADHLGSQVGWRARPHFAYAARLRHPGRGRRDGTAGRPTSASGPGQGALWGSVSGGARRAQFGPGCECRSARQ